MPHQKMPYYEDRRGLIVIPIWALTQAQQDCQDEDIRPRVGDTLTSIEWTSDELVFSFSDTRESVARHFIAQPWSLFKWSIRIGWYDLKRFIRGNKRRPLETVADVEARS